jgi:hypothetical protein
MTNPRSVHAWIFTAVAGAAVATALSGSAVAQTVLEGGPPGAGGPLPNLVPVSRFFRRRHDFFYAG